MLKQISKWSVLIFSIFWILYIFLDYWGNHLAAYSNGLAFFRFPSLALSILVVSGGLSFGLWKWKKRDNLSLLLSGWGILLLSMVWMVISITTQFMSLGYSNFGIEAYFKSLGWTFSVIGGVFFLVVSPAFVLGNYLLNYLKAEIQAKERAVVNVAVGLVLLVLLLFILGILKLLILPILLPLLLFFLGVFWRTTFSFWRKSLLTPFAIGKELSPLGISSFSLLLFFIAINTLQVIRPYPFGFDSLAIYSNLAALIGEYQGLVIGFQPYNWSLLMSLGYSLFGKVEFSLGISAMGGILSVWALYKVSQRWLDVNHALLSSLIFYTLPTVGFQTYKDVKVDLGLLFIMLSIFIVFLNWIDKVIKKESVISSLKDIVKEGGIKTPTPAVKNSFLQEYNLIILLGLLSGFALGIKLTSLFIVIAIVGGIWYVQLNGIGLVTVFLGSMAVILLGRLDNMSGLRAYHLSADILQWILLVLTVVLLGLFFIRKKEILIKSVKITSVYTLFFLLGFIHWPIKNGIESGSTSINAVLYGQVYNDTSLSPIDIKKNWEEFQQKTKK